MRPSSSFRQIAALLSRVILLACLCFSVPSAAHASRQDPAQNPALLRVGFFLTPPHAYALPSGQAAGAAVDLLIKYIAPLMDIPVEVVGPYPFARLIHDFDSRKLDGILMLSRTPDREQLFQYPRHPFWHLTASLAVLEDSPLKEYAPGTPLKRMRVGSIAGVWMPKTLLASGARFDPTTGDFATVLNMQKLINGRVEAVYCPDAATLQESLKHIPDAPPIRLLTIPAPKHGIYTVFANHVPADIVRSYERALLKALTNISYKSLEQQHLQTPVE